LLTGSASWGIRQSGKKFLFWWLLYRIQYCFINYDHVGNDLPANCIRRKYHTALYYISFIIGGVGYSVPLGLLLAGISVSSWFMKTLPKWLILSGIVLHWQVY
jgi:hypothetical protein